MQSKSLSILHNTYNVLQRLSCCVTFTIAQTLDTRLTNRIKHKDSIVEELLECFATKVYMDQILSFLDAQASLPPTLARLVRP